MHEVIGELQSANELLDDSNGLNTRFERDGYLYFRGLLDLQEVLRVKQDFVGALQEAGVVKTGCTEPLWTGVPIDQIDDNALYALASHELLLESQRTTRVMEQVFGEPVFRYRNTTIRFALPDDEKHITPPHQDHFFIPETAEFRTVWIPLMDIEPQMGPLAIAVGSHIGGLLDHVEHETASSYVFRGRKQRGVPLERISHPWLTTTYRPGDVLIFHSHTLHRALANTSDKIRLSLDTRFQPVSVPRTWQSQKTILELRQYRRDVRHIAMQEEGASEELFEALLLKMMERGLEPERVHLRGMIAELRKSGS